PQLGGLANNPNLIIQVTDTALGLPANVAQLNGIYFNQPVANAAGAWITSLNLVGNGGSDTFVINGNLGVGNITIIGQGGAGNNTVRYVDTTNPPVATTYQITNTLAAAPNPAN